MEFSSVHYLYNKSFLSNSYQFALCESILSLAIHMHKGSIIKWDSYVYVMFVHSAWCRLIHLKDQPIVVEFCDSIMEKTLSNVSYVLSLHL